MTSKREPIRIFEGILDDRNLVMSIHSECVVIQVTEGPTSSTYGYHVGSDSFYVDQLPALPKQVSFFQETAKKIIEAAKNGQFITTTYEEGR